MKGVTGGRLPAQIWHRFMMQVLRGNPDFESMPPEVATFEAVPRHRVKAKELSMELLEPEPAIKRRAEAPSYPRSSFRGFWQLPGWPRLY